MRLVAWLAITAACGLPESGLGPVDAAVVTVDVATPDAIADVAAEPEAGMPDAPSDVVEEMPALAGDALAFTGGSYVSIGNFPIPNDFTIEAWIHPTTSKGETYIVAQDKSGQAPQFRFGLLNGQLFFIMSDASGNVHGLYTSAYALITPSALTLGVWTHVAVAKSGGMFALAINGVASASIVTPPFNYGGPAVAMRIAARVDADGTSANGPFEGTIDEVRIWNYARTIAEVNLTMSTTVPFASPGLIANWRFDDATGTSAKDETAAHPGSLVANPTWIVSTAF